jgi:hypothetical protein
MGKQPWKAHPMARRCEYCGSYKPGVQPLSLIVDGKVKRGYWHLKCFEKAKQEVQEKKQ